MARQGILPETAGEWWLATPAPGAGTKCQILATSENPRWTRLGYWMLQQPGTPATQPRRAAAIQPASAPRGAASGHRTGQHHHRPSGDSTRFRAGPPGSPRTHQKACFSSERYDLRDNLNLKHNASSHRAALRRVIRRSSHKHPRAPCNSSWQKLMSLQPFGYCAPAHLPAAPFAYHGWAKSYVWYPVRGAARDPNPPFASIDSNAGPCPTLAICPELVGALRAQKERPFTLNAAAIR